MQSHAALPYFHFSSPYRKWVSFFKFTVYIVKIDKKQNPLKSTAENDSSLLQCIWIVCTTPELVCGRGRGGKVLKQPVLYTLVFVRLGSQWLVHGWGNLDLDIVLFKCISLMYNVSERNKFLDFLIP